MKYAPILFYNNNKISPTILPILSYKNYSNIPVKITQTPLHLPLKVCKSLIDREIQKMFEKLRESAKVQFIVLALPLGLMVHAVCMP